MKIIKNENEKFTRCYCTDREEWLKERGNGLGGSDAAAVIGQNPYKSNEQLFLEKTGQVIPEDISNKQAVRYGSLAEDAIRRLFALEHEKEYIVKHDENCILIDEKYPFIRASLDGELDEIDENGELTGRRGGLEIKTTNIYLSYKFENWRDGVPQNYYCQVLHYFNVTKFDFYILCAELRRTTEKDGVIFTRKQYYFDRNDPQIQEDMKYLLEQEIDYWENNIKKRKQPNLKISI